MNPSASLSYTDGAFMCAIRRANHPPHKLLPPAVSARHLHTREPLGRHGHAEQCVTRAPALPEGLLEAPVAEGTDPEEQETFETGVGLVEPVEEDEAEVCLSLTISCPSPCWVPMGRQADIVVDQCHIPCAMQIDFLGEPTTGNLHLVSRVTSEGLANVLGLRHFDEIIETPYKSLQHSQRVRPTIASQTTMISPKGSPSKSPIFPVAGTAAPDEGAPLLPKGPVPPGCVLQPHAQPALHPGLSF